MEIEKRIGESFRLRLRDGRLITIKIVKNKMYGCEETIVIGFDAPRDVIIDREEVHKIRMAKQ